MGVEAAMRARPLLDQGVVKEACMQNRLARMVLPAVFVVLSGAPAFAQIRIGVDLGAVQIRIAPNAPPPLRREYRSARPSGNHVWIAGYWDREGDQWAWAPGRWEEPSQEGSSWVRPQYRQESGAYRYEPGHWSHQRMEEGEDYHRWRNEHGRGHAYGHDKQDNRGDHGRDHERGDEHRDR
jgi:hypothetical protein